MWSAAIEYAEGSRARGAHDMAAVAADAETDLDRALFLGSGPHVLGVLRALPRSSRSGFVTSITDAVHRATDTGASSGCELDDLSERELDVLQYLPTRLTNAEIAEHLYISLNTLKTHLKHVYRKLGVQRRRDAITAAEQAGLL
jgi:LuxR family maltose regulon positive regulatory protein